jgi:uncharacterized protein
MPAEVVVRPAPRRTKTAFIDCDVHSAVPSWKVLQKYLPRRWASHLELFGVRRYRGAWYPRATPNAARIDAWPPSGLPPGSDLAFMQEQLLDAYDIEYAVLNPENQADRQNNLDYGAALASAMNQWQIEAWLDKDTRLRASIVVAYEDPNGAAAEVERLGGDRRFVQILLYSRTEQPLGHRKYWPLYEAAVRHQLPIGIHFGGHGGHPATGAGWPSFYLEEHVGMSQAFQAQVVSLVCEGVFEQFPALKVVLIEGGFAWIAPLAWRLDRGWGRLREEVPHLTRSPSEYIREHIWSTTQPMEEPHRREHFLQVLAALGHERLVFSTDYPHWDFDAPYQALPVPLPEPLERKIMAENARALYRL